MTCTIRSFAALSCLLLLAGCNPYTYVNVPAQAGDVALHDPNQKLVREVEVEAIRALLLERPLPMPVAIQLPQGTTELTASDVARRAGDGVVAAQPALDGQQQDQPEQAETQNPASSVRITQVRVRGLRAQVDVMYPTVAGMSQLLTVYESYTVANGWRSERIVDWPGASQSMGHEETQP